MLNISKVSSGGGKLSEIDISSVYAERSSPVLSLRIGPLRRAHPGFRRRFILLGEGLYVAIIPSGALWRALRAGSLSLLERSEELSTQDLSLRSALGSVLPQQSALKSTPRRVSFGKERSEEHSTQDRLQKSALKSTLRRVYLVFGGLRRALHRIRHRVRIAVGALWRALRARFSS